MVKPFEIEFSPEAKAAAEATSSLERVEAKAREDIATYVTWPGSYGEIDLPPGGFLSFRMPDGTKFCVWFFGPSHAGIQVVPRFEVTTRRRRRRHNKGGPRCLKADRGK